MQLGEVFWLTVLVIFVVTIVGAFVRRLRKDKCLKLLHDHHVTFLDEAGRPLWGDLWVSSQGLEITYDAPYRTSRGLVKSSCLVFPDEWAGFRALCRSEHGLTDAERAARRRQVQRSFDPGPGRRLLRGIRNFVNTVRDAFAKTLGLFVGAVAGRGQVGQAVGAQGKEVGALGDTLLGTIANAYEPLLERHVGRPVVLSTGGHEFPGFLVDYTERFLAVFNTDHDPEEEIRVDAVAGEPVERTGLTLALPPGRVEIRCSGGDLLVVRRLEVGPRVLDLDVTLLPGCRLDLPREDDAPVTLHALRTRRVDLVCPRAGARIRFGSEPPGPERAGWSGVAPEAEAD